MKQQMFSLSRLKSRSLRGFSLAEVLIAIVIITILTIGSIAVYSTQLAKARDTERTNDVARIKLMLDQFVAEYGLPPNPDIADAKRVSRNTKVKDNCAALDTLYKCFSKINYSSKEDLLELFSDPSQGIPNNQASPPQPYGYLYGADQNTYKICTMLEDQASKMLNSTYAGAEGAAGSNDDLYCISYTPPGVASPVAAVTLMDDPFDISL